MELSNKILSDIIVYTKYAKYNSELKRRETWEEIVTRNKNMHIKKYPKLKDKIEDVYKLVYNKKILPSMRSLQFAGRPAEISPNRIFNCSYLPVDDWQAFSEIMFLLLCGCGVGFGCQKHQVEKLPEIRKPNPNKKKRYLVGDSIEGWSDAIKVLMKSYFKGGMSIDFDFTDIRPKGALLVTSGGKAPGPRPLIECIVKIQSILDTKQTNDRLKSIEVHDIVCHIADAVLAGGIRRSALISLFSADDEEMIACKTGNWWELNPQRGRANNSAVLVRHKITKKFFLTLWERIKASNSGEPGIFFTNDKDYGTNPCVEASLKEFTFCNLCEINASNIESQEDFNQRSKAAAFIGTMQAGYTNFHYLRDIWKQNTDKDALLGVGLTGIASNVIFKYNIEEASEAVKKENARVAKLIGINKAARCTVVKPSGTSSCVLGTSSGIHAWHAPYYIRRVRVGKNESIYNYLSKNHPELLEDDYFRAHDTSIISVPQKATAGAITRTESALHLLERVKTIQKEWIRPGHRIGANSHNISATISIKDNEWEKVGEWMWKNKKYYTGLSVLPYSDHSYKQSPFEECTKAIYDEMMKSLNEIDLTKVIELEDQTDLQGEAACAGGACEVR